MDKKRKLTLAVLIGVAGLLLAVVICALCIMLIPSGAPANPDTQGQPQAPTGPDPATVVRSPAITGEEEYGKVAVGRKKSNELVGDLLADGHPLPFDRSSSTFYLSVADNSIGNYVGVAFSVVGSKGEDDLTIVFNDDIDKHSYFQIPSNNKTYRFIVYNDTQYQSCVLYVTTMPFVTIETEKGKTISSSDVKCTITLRDGNWREHGAAPVTTSHALIHVRGASSASFPKKAYKINFRESDYQTNRDLSLLGLRSDDDYVLDAMYIDPTRMHNKLSTEIWNEMNPENNASDGEYVEVILNGVYVGLYDLIEPIDKKQLDLDTDNGLLIKAVGWNGTYFDKYSGQPSSTTWMDFELKYPKEKIKAKSWGLFYELLSATADAEAYPDDFLDVAELFDHENLTDYWLWLTVFSLRDNRGKNLFWSTKDITDLDYPYIITPWDCDLGFGYRYGKKDTNILNLPHHRDHYENDYIDDFVLLTRYLEMDVNDAKATVEERWDELSAEGGVLYKESIKERITKYRTYLEDTGAWEREMKTWPDAMNPDPDEEFEYMDEWLDGRYEWMEKRIMEVVYDIPIKKNDEN